MTPRLIDEAVKYIQAKQYIVKSKPEKWDSNSFYHIVSETKWGTPKHPKQARREVNKTQLTDENIYFFLAFQPDADYSEICPDDPETTLKKVLNRSFQNRENPKQRDMHAAAEFLARKIHILYYSDRCTQEIVIQPPFERFPTDDILHILMVKQSENVAYIALQPMIGAQTNVMKHSDCHGVNFRTNPWQPLEIPVSNTTETWKLSRDIRGLYYCLSQEMYGSVEFHEFLRDVIIKYIQDGDKLDILYEFIGDPRDNVKKRKEKVKEYILKIKMGCYDSGKAELYAAASIFRTQIYVKKTTVWDVYQPLFLPGSATPRQSFITLTDKMWALVPSNVPCNCLLHRPEVMSLESIRKDLMSWADNVLKTSCCPGDLRHDRHKHLAEYRTKPSTTVLYQRTECLTPNRDTKTVLDLLQKDGRTLDVVGTFRACIYKEIYHSDDVPDSFDVCSDSPDHNDIKAIACWLKRDIYIYSKDEANQIFKWNVYQSVDMPNDCRYYITLFHNKTESKYDIVMPMQGCNCAMAPPDGENATTQKVDRMPSIIQKEERHNPMLEYFEDDIKDSWFSDETRRYMPRHGIPQIYEAFGRPDMIGRGIDSGSNNNSLYSCISKEVFGNENQTDVIESLVAREINQNPQEYIRMLSVKTRMKEDKNEDVYGTLSPFLLLYRDLPLFAAATVFQTPIYVMRVDYDGKSKWHDFTQIRRKPRPQLMPSSVSVCCQRSSSHAYYLSLLQDPYGNFFRIVPREVSCNCQMDKPDIPGIFQPNITPESEHGRTDSNTVADRRDSYSTIRAEFRELDDVLGRLMYQLGVIQSLISTQLLLYELIVAIFESRRRNINIASISGSSVSSVGAALVVLGFALSPVTVGVSLGLTIAGGVISGVGGATVVGANITEGVLTKSQLHSLIVVNEVLEQLSQEAEVLKSNFINVAKRALPKMARFSGTNGESLTACGFGIFTFDTDKFLRVFSIMFVVIARLTGRVSAVIIGVVSGAFSLLIDTIVIAYAVYNLNKGNKTPTSEAIRKNVYQLRALKINIDTYLNGSSSRL